MLIFGQDFRNYAQTLPPPLKKAAAIFFASLVLFNALGFYGVLMGIQYTSSRDLTSRLDTDDYHDDETVTLKFPMALPYHIDKGTYDRVDGNVQYNGEFYRLVKQKLERDTLYIVCIKDQGTKRIADALSDYVKTFTDNPVDSKQTVKQASIIKDFVPATTSILSASAGWDHIISQISGTIFFDSIALAHASPPPRA